MLKIRVKLMAIRELLVSIAKYHRNLNFFVPFLRVSRVDCLELWDPNLTKDSVGKRILVLVTYLFHLTFSD